MKKEKIISSHNTEKMWWIRVRPSSNSVRYIDKILKGLDPQGLGLGLEEDYYDKVGKIFSYNYRSWNGGHYYFFVDNECGYIFFMKNGIEILLRTETKLFDKLSK